MKTKLFLTSIVILGILLGGCGPAAQPAATDAPPTQPPPTALPAPTATPVPPTNTPLPTDTPLPTNTPVPTNTPTPAISPTPFTCTDSLGCVEIGITNLEIYRNEVDSVGGIWLEDPTNKPCGKIKADFSDLHFVPLNPNNPQDMQANIYYKGVLWGQYIQYGEKNTYKFVKQTRIDNLQIPLQILNEMGNFSEIREKQRIEIIMSIGESQICGFRSDLWGAAAFDSDDIGIIKDYFPTDITRQEALMRSIIFWAAISDEYNTTKIGQRNGNFNLDAEQEDGIFGISSEYLGEIVRGYSKGMPESVSFNDRNNRLLVWHTENGISFDWIKDDKLVSGLWLDENGVLHVVFSSVFTESEEITGDEWVTNVANNEIKIALLSKLGYQPSYVDQAYLLYHVIWTYAQDRAHTIFNSIRIQ